MQPQCAPIQTTRVADQVLTDAARASAAIHAANSLMGDGYVVTSIQTETRSIPVVWIAFDKRLPARVAHDQAGYYKQGVDDGGKYRVCQYWHMGCVVQWR